MSTNDDRGDGDSSIFNNKSEREQALLAMAVEAELDIDAAREEYERLLAEAENGEELLYYGARRAGWNPCGCEDVECEHTLAVLGLTESDVSDRENAGPSTDPLDGFDDPAFLPDGSGRENAAAYPTGDRSSYERRKRAVERGEREPRPPAGSAERRVNMGAVPGNVRRNYDDRTNEDPEEYPGGDRQSWERRQVGEEDVADDSPDPPGGTRSDYERRRENAESPYPWTSKRLAEWREEHRRARERRKAAAKRAARRERLSGGSEA